MESEPCKPEPGLPLAPSTKAPLPLCANAQTTDPPVMIGCGWLVFGGQRSTPHRGSQGLRLSRVGSFTCVNEVLGNLSQLDVEVLRGLTQNMESLVGGDPFAFDEDPLGLADQLSRDQGGMKVLGTAFLVLVRARGGTGNPTIEARSRPLARSRTPKA